MLILPPWSHPLFGIAALLLGASIGSFLNVVIYRIPRGMSVNTPKRSFCPQCKEPIPMWRNIPLFTWLIQRGKCAECSESISVRYFIVELLTALVWVGCWLAFPNDPAESLFFMLLSSIFIVICAVDIELMLIPRHFTIAGTLLGLGFAALSPEWMGESVWYLGLLKSFYGFAFGWLGLWLVVLLGKLLFGKRSFSFDAQTEWKLREPQTDEEELCFIMDDEVIGWSDIFFRKTDVLILKDLEEVCIDGKIRSAHTVEIRENTVTVEGEVFQIEEMISLEGKAKKAVIPREAMGMGDVDLLGMLGACLGPLSLVFTVFAACIVSIVWALLNRIGLGRMIPFGPSLIAGAALWVFWGEDIWYWYLHSMGVSQ